MSAIPIDETTVGWVPIEEEQFDSTTTSSSLSTSSTTTSQQPPQYSTTSFKDAQIQYRPLSSKQGNILG